jgi:hypothetical protein
MGIPRLTKLLHPYASVEPLREAEVVLDGPAFCYHIYHICLCSRGAAPNPFEAGITNAELGAAAVAWLKALQTSNVSM